MTRRPARGRSGRWATRLLVALLIVVIVFTGLAVWTQLQMGNAGNLAALAPEGRVFLIVGSDNRANLPPDLGEFFGDFAGARADVIILAQVGGGRRQLLSIPRDLRVDVPGFGIQKINAAYALGGPNLLVETVALATGIRASHYLEVEFGGFARIVDALGGIELDFPYPARDQKSGLAVEAGTQTVGGATALAYARSRVYEEFRDGRWVSEASGDIARTGRQREVLLKIMAEASSPSGLVRSPLVMAAVGSYLTADAGTNVFTLLLTGAAMRVAGETDSVALPVNGLNEGGISYVVRAEPAATTVIDTFRAMAPLSSP